MQRKNSNRLDLPCFSALLFCVFLSFTIPAHGFSLLGPYTDWMMQTNGYRQRWDIGGPMDINEGYRWNVPEVTYAFDNGFLDYFGPNGVAAVESAIQLLNDLAPASKLVPTNYPFDSMRMNFVAESQRLTDLKSLALSALLEHMGLAQPTRYVFAFRRWNPQLSESEPAWPDGTIPYYIVQRNFDPETLGASPFVNRILYTSIYTSFGMWSFRVDPLSPISFSAADGFREPGLLGAYFTGLTFDDVGGLRFLLSRTNVNYELLLADVRGISRHGRHVNGAWRPGIEKVKFTRQHYDPISGRAVPYSYYFTDTFITDAGLVRHQKLKRVVTTPDFLFSVTNPSPDVPFPFAERTDTANWHNYASLNGHVTNAGPGVIQPQVKIAFPKQGPLVGTLEDNSVFILDQALASFGSSTNAPTTYPVQTPRRINSLTILFNLYGNKYELLGRRTWSLPVSVGSVALLQGSTNLVNWETFTAITNNGATFQWNHLGTNPRQRFFRAIPGDK